MFYYVESTEKIALAFADSLGGLLSVVAQNLELTLEVALHRTQDVLTVSIFVGF
jgi:hypothetical protein